MRNPNTGRVSARIRIWYEAAGESPGKPYTVKRLWEDRWIGVPGERIADTSTPWEVSTEHGDTPDPLP